MLKVTLWCPVDRKQVMRWFLVGPHQAPLVKNLLSWRRMTSQAFTEHVKRRRTERAHTVQTGFSNS